MKFTKLLAIINEMRTKEVDVQLINQMQASNLIKKKSLGNGLISLNFSDDVFRDSIWNSMTTKARGLFFSEKLKKIVARGYDKFFNLGEEVAGDKLEINKMNLQYPVTAWHKYNGYLGIMSVNEIALNDIVYTGVFFNKTDIEKVINEINAKTKLNILTNIKNPHVTLHYYKNEEEKNTTLESFEKQKKTKYSYKINSVFISEDQNLIALSVNGEKGQNEYPHITLYAGGNYKPVQSNDLLAGKIKGQEIQLSNTTIEGNLLNSLKNGMLEPIGDRDTLFIASKSTDAGDFASLFQKILVSKFYTVPGKLSKIKKFIKQVDVSLVFEVIDPNEDPHIIKYGGANIVLLDIIYNQMNFKSIPYNSLIKWAKYFKLDYKKPVGVFKSREELDKFIQEIIDPDYKLHGEPIEGFVFEDSTHYMFKFKSNFYNYWKKMRGAVERLRNTLEQNPKEIEKKIGIMKDKNFLGNKEFLDFCLDNKALVMDTKESNIIILRDKFLEKYPNFKITTVVHDIDNPSPKTQLTPEEETAKINEVKKAWTDFILTKNNALKIKEIPTNVKLILNRDSTQTSNAINFIKEDNATLVILVGPQGSGKSRFIEGIKGANIHSTDNYFMKNGKYEWKKDELHVAHENNLKKAKESIDKSQLAIIDNTNLKFSDFKEYVKYAKEKKYKIKFVIFLTNPDLILGNEGINSEKRIKEGKSFSGNMEKIYTNLLNFYKGGVTQIINEAKKLT